MIEEVSILPLCMPAPLKTTLTAEESDTLHELRVANSVHHRVRDRAHMVLLNADGWSVAEIANIFQCHQHTVRASLNRWQTSGLYGLWEKGGRGQKPTWNESDLAYLEQCLEEDGRTYNSRQLAAKLAADRQVTLSPDRIRRLLKKRTIDGNARDTATDSGKTQPLEPMQKLN